MLDVGQNVLAVPRVQAAAGDQTLRVFSHVIGDPLIDFRGKADDFRRHIIDQHATINTNGIHVFEEQLGRTAELKELLEVGALASEQFHRLRTEHIHRRDVDVAVGDQVRRNSEPNLQKVGAGFDSIPDNNGCWFSDETGHDPAEIVH